MNPSSEPVQLIAAAAGALLSLAAAYVPGFAGWYQALAGVHKRLVMVGLLAGVSLLALGLACSGAPAGGGGWGLPVVDCSQPGAWTILGAFLTALAANQATFLVAVRPAGGPAVLAETPAEAAAPEAGPAAERDQAESGRPQLTAGRPQLTAGRPLPAPECVDPALQMAAQQTALALTAVCDLLLDQAEELLRGDAAQDRRLERLDKTGV